MTPGLEGAPAVPERRGFDLSPCFLLWNIRVSDCVVRARQMPAALVHGAKSMRASQHGAVRDRAVRTSGTSRRLATSHGAEGRVCLVFASPSQPVVEVEMTRRRGCWLAM